MARRASTPEPIINKLRKAEGHLSQGDTVGVAKRKIGVAEQTYYRWRREYGGMRLEQATSEGSGEGELSPEEADG